MDNPEQYIAAVLDRVKPQHIERTYDIRGFGTATQFLELLARKGGRLHRGGEADVNGVAKMVLNDFLRGKLPWYTPPPVTEGDGKGKGKGIEGREGRLGEMGRKRKREEDRDGDGDGDAFEGFDDDGAGADAGDAVAVFGSVIGGGEGLGREGEDDDLSDSDVSGEDADGPDGGVFAKDEG